MTMKLTTVPGLPAPIAPDVVAKTDKSITLRVTKTTDADEYLKFQVVRRKRCSFAL